MVVKKDALLRRANIEKQYGGHYHLKSELENNWILFEVLGIPAPTVN